MRNTLRNIFYSITPVRLRYPKMFWDYYNFINESKFWSRNKLEEYQWNEVKRILKYAYENSTFYRDLYNQHSIKLRQIQNFHDFESQIPIVSKKQIRENLDDVVTIPPKKRKYVTTGGSTGIPFGFYLEKGTTYEKTRAFEWRQHNEGDYYFNDKVVVLRGMPIAKGLKKWDARNNYLYLSTYKLSEENIDEYLKIIKDFSPQHIKCYPSSGEFFAKLIQNRGIEFNPDKKIKSIFTSSENLSSEQRITIEETLNAPIFDKYGNTEQCSIIGQCKFGNYHDYMEYSYSEYLLEDKQNTKRRLISTSFINYATPFIRYDTEDFFDIEDEKYECKCGMNNKVIKSVFGRWSGDNYLITNKNQRIPLTGLNTHSSIFDNVYRIQYVQSKVGKVELYVVPKKSFSNKDEQAIYKELNEKFLQNIELTIKRVKDVAKTPSGKVNLLVQKIDK